MRGFATFGYATDTVVLETLDSNELNANGVRRRRTIGRQTPHLFLSGHPFCARRPIGEDHPGEERWRRVN